MPAIGASGTAGATGAQLTTNDSLWFGDIGQGKLTGGDNSGAEDCVTGKFRYTPNLVRAIRCGKLQHPQPSFLVDNQLVV